MKKPPAPLTHPLDIQITPRLLAAVEASLGRRLPPGTRIHAMPPAPPNPEPITASPIRTTQARY